MTGVVVEASVAVKLSAAARKLLAAEYKLVAPELLWAELRNVLWKKHRRRELDQRMAGRLLRDFSRVPIEFHRTAHGTGAALDLAMRHGVTVYGALYLSLAAGHGCRVLTADRRLQEACRDGGIRHLVDWVEELW